MKRKTVLGAAGAGTALLLIAAIVLGVVFYPRQGAPLSESQRAALSAGVAATAAEDGPKGKLKRQVDETHPLNLITYYPVEKTERADGVTELWESLPEDVRRYSVLVLIPGNVMAPGESDKELIALARECEANKIPFSIQNINGETHMEWRMPLNYIEKTFCKMEYFYGLSAAELYNGIQWRGGLDGDQSQYVADCIRLMARYGEFWIWTDTNKFGKNGNLADWIEENECLYSALKEHHENVFLLNKESYGDPSTYALMSGLYLAGLIGGWGVASDWWHWQVSNFHSLFGKNDDLIQGEWERILYYPEAMHVQSMMMVSAMGGFCFKNEAQYITVSVYGDRLAGFEYATIPFLRQLFSGRFRIPSRKELLSQTRVCVLGAENYAPVQYHLEESTLYPNTPNIGIIPLLPKNLRRDEREVLRSEGISVITQKVTKELLAPYIGQDATGDTYTASAGDQWYWMNHMENEDRVNTAVFSQLRKNACSVSLSAGPHTFAMLREEEGLIQVHLNNYRVDKDRMVEALDGLDGSAVRGAIDEWLSVQKDGSVKAGDSTLRETRLIIKGETQRPQVRFLSDTKGGANARPFQYEERYQEAAKKLTVVIRHNGPVNFEILTGQGKTQAPCGTKQSNLAGLPLTDGAGELKQALEVYSVDDLSAYAPAGREEYLRARELCRVLEEEKTASKEARANAIQALAQARKKLVDLRALQTQLNTFAALTEEQKNRRAYAAYCRAYDRALLEALPPAPHFRGKDDKLTFEEKQKFPAMTEELAAKKQHSADAAAKRLERAYARLKK